MWWARRTLSNTPLRKNTLRTQLARGKKYYQECCSQAWGGETDSFPSSQPLDKTNLWTCGFMSHHVCRSLCWSQEKGHMDHTANNNHCAEPTVYRPRDGEIENGTGNRVVVLGSEWGAELLPGSPLTYLWQFSEKGKEILGAQVASSLPPFPPSQPTHAPTAGFVQPGAGTALCWWRTPHLLGAKDSPGLAKPLSPLPHSW